MGDKTKIEWADLTWGPVTGCTKVSAGCDNCYAEKIARRFAGTPAYPNGFAVTLRPERLGKPFKWRKPRRIFVNSMSDLFHADVPDEYIAKVWAVMALTPQHTYQVLTKRHGRMRSLLSSERFAIEVARQAETLARERNLTPPLVMWTDIPNVVRAVLPLRNVWLGVSVEDQRTADLRIPALLDTPAAVRWISAEPLLGPVDISRYVTVSADRLWCSTANAYLDRSGSVRCRCNFSDTWARISWVVVGGESGPGARPMHPAWARSLRDQCQAAGVRFLFKQWGQWVPSPWKPAREPGETDDAYRARADAAGATHAFTSTALYRQPDGSDVPSFMKLDHRPWSAERGPTTPGGAEGMRRVARKADAGRELDGRTWDEYPASVTS